MKVHRLFKTAKIYGVSVFLCLILSTTISIADQSDALDSMDISEVSMVIGELITLRVYSMTRVSVADPDAADIVDANDNKLILIGKTVGQTPLFIWDEHGKRTIIVRVINEDLNVIKARIIRLFKVVDIYEAKVSVNTLSEFLINPASIIV